MKLGERLEANAPEALLSNIAPIEQTSNADFSFHRVITEESLTSKASKTASQHLPSISQERCIERLEKHQEQVEKPFQVTITPTTTSSSHFESDTLAMNSSEFNLEASNFLSWRASSPFASEEDDDMSIGTIDNFCNIIG